MTLMGRRSLIWTLSALFGCIFVLWTTARISISTGTVPERPLKSTYGPGANICRGDPLEAEFETVGQSASDALSVVEQQCESMTEERLNECKVPPIVHFVLGFPGRFDFYSYIAVKSAHDRLRPDAIYLHVFGLRFDTTPYLERAIDELGVKIVGSRDVREVFDRPVEVPERRSDAIRLESLIRFGGIYLDMDAFVLQPLDVFYSNELTMPQENTGGVNNGIMIAKRCSRFLRLWYQEYQSFVDSDWGYHSIVLPKKLSLKYPDLIQVEPDTLQSDFKETFYQLVSENLDEAYWRPVLAVHSFIRLASEKYDEESIKSVTNNFGIMVRRILAGKPGMMD